MLRIMIVKFNWLSLNYVAFTEENMLFWLLIVTYGIFLFNWEDFNSIQADALSQPTYLWLADWLCAS